MVHTYSEKDLIAAQIVADALDLDVFEGTYEDDGETYTYLACGPYVWPEAAELLQWVYDILDEDVDDGDDVDADTDNNVDAKVSDASNTLDIESDIYDTSEKAEESDGFAGGLDPLANSSNSSAFFAADSSDNPYLSSADSLGENSADSTSGNGASAPSGNVSDSFDSTASSAFTTSQAANSCQALITYKPRGPGTVFRAGASARGHPREGVMRRLS